VKALVALMPLLLLPYFAGIVLGGKWVLWLCAPACAVGVAMLAIELVSIIRGKT
jgi:hypothetical protein